MECIDIAIQNDDREVLNRIIESEIDISDMYYEKLKNYYEKIWNESKKTDYSVCHQLGLLYKIIDEFYEPDKNYFEEAFKMFVLSVENTNNPKSHYEIGKIYYYVEEDIINISFVKKNLESYLSSRNCMQIKS